MFESDFPGSEGRIHYRRWDPAEAPRRIVHGYAEHGGRYEGVARALTARGAVVYADDHIGHGRSDGERALITDFGHVVDDLVRLGERATERNPSLPQVLVGHSMGGLLTGLTARRAPDRVAGVTLCGAVIGDWEWGPRGAGAARTAVPPLRSRGALPRPGSRARLRRRSPRVSRPVQAGASRGGSGNTRRVPGAAGPAHGAVLFLHGTDDPFVPYGRSLRAVEELPSADKEIHIDEGARHEILHETNRDEVIGHLADRIDRIGPRGTRRRGDVR